MLCIESSVFWELKQTFLYGGYEQGYILGSKEFLERIDCCKLIPATHSGEYFYTPDNHSANLTIREWAEDNICFSGFIHSHTKGRMDFSDNDIIFANKLLDSYRIPFLWFGLAVITKENDVSMMFYRIYKEKGRLLLNSDTIKIV